jgi:hypothetical protein
MQLSHRCMAGSAVFDEPNLVSSAGLVPVLVLAESAGLGMLAEQHLTVPTDKGANAGWKVTSLVGGMVAGADSIDGMRLLRHGGMGRLFARTYSPSTLGSFLRSFRFGHVRQLDAVAARFLAGLAARSPLLAGAGTVLVDVDDTIIEVHGYAKKGRRVRLLEGPRVERAAGHRRFGRVRPGGGGAAAPPGGGELGARRGTAGRRRPQDSVTRVTPGRSVLLRADAAEVSDLLCKQWLPI